MGVSENVGQTLSDPGQKLIVYTLPSIWQYSFFQNATKIRLVKTDTHNKLFFFVVLFERVSSKLTSSWPPAREVGLGTAALAPLWADPRDPGDPQMNSARPFLMRRRVQIDTFARNWASIFRIVSHSFV